MSKKSQAERLAAMVQSGQSVRRPSNLPDEQGGKPGNRKGGKAAEGQKVERITVGTKARREIAHYWTAQGKLRRRSVTDVVREALIAEFGLPDGFTEEDV